MEPLLCYPRRARRSTRTPSAPRRSSLCGRESLIPLQCYAQGSQLELKPPRRATCSRSCARRQTNNNSRHPATALRGVGVGVAADSSPPSRASGRAQNCTFPIAIAQFKVLLRVDYQAVDEAPTEQTALQVCVCVCVCAAHTNLFAPKQGPALINCPELQMALIHRGRQHVTLRMFMRSSSALT